MTARRHVRSVVAMRLVAVVAVVAALSSPVAADEWTRRDTALELAVVATLAADYLQTRQVVADGMESNPVIGDCRGEIGAGVHCGGMSPALYFAGVALLHAGAMRLLPTGWRNAAQGLTIGFQLRTIEKNWAAGYAVRF